MVNCFSCITIRSYFIVSHHLVLHFIFESDFNTGLLHEIWICPY